MSKTYSSVKAGLTTTAASFMLFLRWREHHRGLGVRQARYDTTVVFTSLPSIRQSRNEVFKFNIKSTAHFKLSFVCGYSDLASFMLPVGQVCCEETIVP